MNVQEGQHEAPVDEATDRSVGNEREDQLSPRAVDFAHLEALVQPNRGSRARCGHLKEGNGPNANGGSCTRQQPQHPGLPLPG